MKIVDCDETKTDRQTDRDMFHPPLSSVSSRGSRSHGSRGRPRPVCAGSREVPDRGFEVAVMARGAAFSRPS